MPPGGQPFRGPGRQNRPDGNAVSADCAAAAPGQGLRAGRGAPLQRHLARETEVSLALRMRFPTRWDPFFTKSTTVADVYHYATEHFEFHRQQLTLDLAGRNTLFRP